MRDRLKYFFLSLFLAASSLVSCDKVHEFPKTGWEVDPTEIGAKITILCKDVISEYDVVAKAVGANDADYDRRFFVAIRSNEYADTLVGSFVVTRDADDLSPLVIETRLQARKYKIVVWMDFVRKGTDTDLYYRTSDGKALNAIHLPESSRYEACSDYKDAQTYTSDLDLTSYSGQWYASVDVTAELSRPVAKITFLSNDLAEYAKSIEYPGPLSDLADDITMEFSYDGYFPTGFNAHTGRLNDSQTGFGFRSLCTYPFLFENKEYVRIGYDYVFVNNDASSVTVTVVVKRKSGQIINIVDNVVVPIKRGRETVVVHKFLTKEYVPGIGIDPGFDGEFDIYV